MIQVLDEVTINQIAAGEVIERPAAALKELLENSADSGATNVEVDFENGGKKLLRVTDNGSGISEGELPLALQRHATSKLRSIEDLQTLDSMGFRGEALASMGAVSRLTLESTQHGAHRGAALSVEGGALQGVRPVSPSPGTRVTVEDLFYNVPARLKFLKSDAGETAAVKKVVKAFALSHPPISIVLRQGGRAIDVFKAKSFEDRAREVLGLSVDEVTSLDIKEGSLRLRAVLGLPRVNAATSQNIWIFVQKRPVVDRGIQYAITEGYRNLLMHQQFPQAVVWLELDPRDVDVNVHPAKAQVKFTDSSSIFRLVSRSIQTTLEASLAQLPAQGLAENYQDIVADQATTDQRHPQQNLIREAVVQYNQRQWQAPQEFHAPKASAFAPQLHLESQSLTESKAEPVHYDRAVGPWSSLQLIGQFANTYLVTQGNQGLVLVDQHAAHERVLFERIKRDHKSKAIERQPSLLEESISFAPETLESLMKHVEVFEDLGFELVQRGPEVLGVVSRPVLLLDVPLQPLLEKMAEQIQNSGGATGLQDLVTDLWATMSCHGAIRAGRVLSQPEMQSLLEQMDEFTFSSFCPHGRPVSVHLSLHDLEKLFKRIV